MPLDESNKGNKKKKKNHRNSHFRCLTKQTVHITKLKRQKLKEQILFGMRKKRSIYKSISTKQNKHGCKHMSRIDSCLVFCLFYSLLQICIINKIKRNTKLYIHKRNFKKPNNKLETLLQRHVKCTFEVSR